jgi:16S rRNA (guanine966-N2)-methyltransferase
MRIVGGQWRGRRLTAPAGRATRPTADRVREAIFDVLGAAPPPVTIAAGAGGTGAVEVTGGAAGVTGGGAEVKAGAGTRFDAAAGDGPLAGVAVLDLFAGSGALGLEALSRGAASCTFVEQAPTALRALRANLAALRPPADVFAVLAVDYRRALKADAARVRRYNLVLVDAPYASYPAVEPELAGRLPGVLSTGAVVVVETARGQAVELALGELSVRLYGDTRVTFLQARS